jgi:hypothetical protein
MQRYSDFLVRAKQDRLHQLKKSSGWTTFCFTTYCFYFTTKLTKRPGT